MKKYLIKLTFLALSTAFFLGCENSYRYTELKIEDLGNNQYKYVIKGLKLESPGIPDQGIKPQSLEIGECRLVVSDSCWGLNGGDSPCDSAKNGCIADILAGDLKKGPHELSIEFTATRGERLSAGLQCPNNDTHKKEINLSGGSRKDPVPDKVIVGETSIKNDNFPGNECPNLPSQPTASPTPFPIDSTPPSRGPDITNPTEPTPTPTPTPDTAPNAPTGLSTSDGDNGIGLSWTDNSSDETAFIVQRSESGMESYTTIATLSSNVTTFTDPSNAVDNPYDYKVAAVKNGLNSFSDVATASAVGPAAPGSTLQAFAVSTQINLTWSDANSIPWNETEIIIERSPASSGTWTQIGTQNPDMNTYTDSTVASSTSYDYRVKAVRGRYQSTYSNTANITSN